MAVSAGGLDLLRLGSATASSDLGGIAIALGANSTATITGGGFANTALAVGNSSLAEAARAISTSQPYSVTCSTRTLLAAMS